MIDGFKISKTLNSMNAIDIITKSVKNSNDKDIPITSSITISCGSLSL